MPGEGAGAFDRFLHAAAHGHMIVLDQNGVIQAIAMISAAARTHRLQLDRSQARRRLAGMGDHRAGLGDSGDILAGQAGDAAHPAQEIQRRALRGEDAKRRAVHNGDHIAGLQRIAIMFAPGDGNLGVHQIKTGVGGLLAGQHPGRAALDHEIGVLVRGDGRQRCDVAAPAQIFIERAGDKRVDQMARQTRDHGSGGSGLAGVQARIG